MTRVWTAQADGVRDANRGAVSGALTLAVMDGLGAPTETLRTVRAKHPTIPRVAVDSREFRGLGLV